MISINIFAIAALINGIVSSTFGFLIISKNWKDRTNQIFFMMTVSLSIWSFSYWQWQLSTNYDTALMWVRILSAGSLFVPVFFYNWVIRLLKDDNLINKILIWLVYTLSIVILFFVNSDLFIASLEKKSLFLFWPNSGIVYDIYFCYIYLGLVTYTLYLLLRSYFIEKDVEIKGQIRFILLGCLFGFGGGLTNFPLWWGVDILPIGNFFVAVFPFFLGYSMLKYKLFNIKAVATQFLTFAIWIFILIRALLSQTPMDLYANLILFLLSFIFGIFLIKSTNKEIAQREKIEDLAKGLEAANERLKELDQQKSEFVSLASHQLRGPLTALKGYASLILEGDFGEVSAPVKEAVDKIFRSSTALAVLVGDYLDVSRIEQGRMQYDFSTFDFKELTKTVVEELKPVSDKAGLNVTFDFNVNDTYIIKADQGKIKQVISNLLDNSIKYTPKGWIKVELSKKNPGSLIELTIQDTGVGIKPEVLPRLFEKFTRAPDASKTNIMGTGLGLYVAKKMIESHNGKIWAESEGAGKGSTFHIELQGV